MAADRCIIDDLRLAASELVTNALEHGEHEPVVVELGVSTGVVSLSVTSRSPHDHVAPVSDWAVADAAEITGRGLGIVRTLADDVSVTRGGEMLTITVERRLLLNLRSSKRLAPPTNELWSHRRVLIG